MKFILGYEEIIYSSYIEYKIDNFFFKSDESNYILFKNLIYLNREIKLNDLVTILKKCFDVNKFKDENIKNYFYEILDKLSNINLKLIDIEKIDLTNILGKINNNEIGFTTNTITSSKGKEYDNVIILNIWNKQTLTNALNEQNINALNHYYVAVSRAKENVFTFVDY
ncbi:MAG: hypothetical protein QM490_04235 [Candidatus Gracilibacteria bacterium]